MLQQPKALAIALAVLLGPLMLPLVLWRILPFGDMAAFHVPMRLLYQQALQKGDTMLWSPAVGSGVYLHAEGQTGMAHPFHLLIYRFLPLTAAINMEMLASYVAAAAGMFRLLRHLSLRRDAAAMGALLFAFSGFQLLHLNHLNMVAVAAHLPWLLYAGDLLMTAPEPNRQAAGFAGVGLVVGSAALVGFPQGVWVNFVALGWLVAYCAIEGSTLSRAALVCAGAVTGILIGGVQLLPTLDALRASSRATAALDFRLTYSLHPFNLVQLFSPYALMDRIYATSRDELFVHEFGLYNGAISTLSLFWVTARWTKLPHRRLAAGLLCISVLALVLALGRYGGVYPLIAMLPGLSGLRAPARHIVLLHFALAGLSAIAIEDAFAMAAGDGPPGVRRLWPLAVPIAAGVVLLIAAKALSGSRWTASTGLHLSSSSGAVAGIATMAAVAGLLAACAMRARWAAPALIVLTALDLTASGTRYAYSQFPIAIAAIAPAAGFPPAADGELVHPHGLVTDVNKFALRGFRSSMAYLGLTRLSALDPNSTAAQRAAAVQWSWTSLGWRRSDRVLARARLLVDARVSAAPAADLERVDSAHTALVDRSVPTLSGPPGAATILHDAPGNILIRTDAPGTQLVVLAERFHDGWRAECDGAAVPIVAVYGDFMGVVVPAGVHSLQLSFAPASFRYGLWATLAGLGLLLSSTSAIAFTAHDVRPGDQTRDRGDG